MGVQGVAPTPVKQKNAKDPAHRYKLEVSLISQDVFEEVLESIILDSTISNWEKMMKSFATLVLLSFCASAQVVLTNDLGYESSYPKTAVFQSNSNQKGLTWSLKKAGEEVESGSLPEGQIVTGWLGKYNHQIVFDDVKQPGQYTLEVNGSRSTTFKIQENLLWKNTLDDLLGFFHSSRADEEDVWEADESVPKYIDGGAYDVRGGWYDASGDISKYLSHLSFGNFTNPQQIPMTAWVLAELLEENEEALIEDQKLEAVKEEAAWGADYLTRVLDPQGYFYITIFDNWNGSLSNRHITAFEGSSGIKTKKYEAAWREGGGVSIAALAKIANLGLNGDSTSVQYLAAAKKGYGHLERYGKNYADDETLNFLDYYTQTLAAIELYKVTGEEEYLSDVQENLEVFNSLQSEEGYFFADLAKSRPYWHAAEAGLPLLILGEAFDLVDSEEQTLIKAMLKKYWNYQLAVSKEVNNPFLYARQTVNTEDDIQNNFFVPHDNETGYWWQGESARQASLSAAILKTSPLAYGGVEKVPSDLLRLATTQIDWILGMNPYNVSMYEGIGDENPPVYNPSPSNPGHASKYPLHDHLKGGISNGITGYYNKDDGSGISWNPSAVLTQGWENWRWVEQWLPHSTWFLMATSAFEVQISGEEPNEPSKNFSQPTYTWNLIQASLHATPGMGFQVYTQDGKKLLSSRVPESGVFDFSQSLKVGNYLLWTEGKGVRLVIH